MAAKVTNRGTIIGTLGLLGAILGIVLGLVEAGCLRLTSFALTFPRPHVPFSFWFLAPLLASVAFGLLGLLAGVVAVLVRRRFPGMAAVAALVGFAGVYFALILRALPSGRAWFVFLREVMSTSLLAALVFGLALAALWVTRTPGSPLGAMDRIPRRGWSVTVLVSMAVLAVSFGLSQLSPSSIDSKVHATARSKSPNIVLIISDATRADHLSSYGYYRNTTPNIDGLAKRGVLFENAISSSSWTLPAISSIFTSLLPHQHGAGADFPLGKGPRTMAEILSVIGYETAGFSANPHFGISPWGLGRGFETYTDTTEALGYSFDASRLGHDIIEPLSEEWFHHSRFNEFNAHQLNEQVYHWFAHRSDRPFFLLVHYDDAHDSYEVPSPYDHIYGPVSEDAKRLLPEAKYSRVRLTAGQRESVIAAYDGSLRFIDSQVGELLRFLQQSPEWSNTYIIMTSDHGEAFGEHNAYTHGWDLYREVLHVPLVVVGPGVPAGVRIKDTASTRKIFPTVLQWSGMKQPVLLQRSLSRMWGSHYVPVLPEEPTVSEFLDPGPPTVARGLISVTTREWHFIYYADHQSRLFHWPSDPLEQHDVAELPDNQAIVVHLEDDLVSIVGRSYRPWRDVRYLEALSNLNLSIDDVAQTSNPLILGRLLLVPAPGAPQALFPPNPESLGAESENSERELLRSLPYGNEQ
jgi:arylsulfatase A-like enzyme